MRARTMTQFLPICTNDPIMAASTTESSPMYTWSPTFMGMNAMPLRTRKTRGTSAATKSMHPSMRTTNRRLTWAARAWAA